MDDIVLYKYHTSAKGVSFGSCTHPDPLLVEGGTSPQQANLSASIMVVLPHPFSPRISVNGEENLMTPFSSEPGPKLLIPDIVNLSKQDISN